MIISLIIEETKLLTGSNRTIGDYELKEKLYPSLRSFLSEKTMK